jgi:fibronectin-binding autotransporter adhesin
MIMHFWPTVFCLAMILTWGKAEAFFPQTAYWKNRNTYSLKYTTGAQSLNSGLCSGPVTVKTYNPTGALTNVTAPLTVNFTENGTTTFYSDANCISPITSLTIASGFNSANFYFQTTTAGSVNLIASATNYQNASQAETITANPFIWTGAGGNSAWSTAANWSGGAVPGSSNIAVFNNSCSTSCSPSITGTISLAGIRLESNFTGAITQAIGATMAVGSSGWIQKGGTFTGGDSTVVISGKLHVETGAFTFPANTLQLYSDVTFKSSATVTATNSTLLLTCTYNVTCIINNSASFNHLSIQGSYTNYNLSGGTINVSGDLTLGDSWGPSELGQVINSGTINVSGNISVINNGFRGSALIVATGNSSGQIITGIANRFMPSLKIASGANPITFSGQLFISNGFTYTSSGAFNVAGSTISVWCPYGLVCPITPGSVTYNNFSLTSYYGGFNLGGGTLKVNGSFSGGDTYGTGYVNQKIDNGTIMAYGDVAVINNGYQGTASVVVAGNSTGQTITGNGPRFALPNLTISAGTNPVTFTGIITTASTFTMNSVGTFTTSGSTLYLSCDYNITCSINPGSAVYNNVTLVGFYSSYTLNGNTMNVNGDLSFGDSFGSGYQNQPINSGTFNVSGNVNVINNGNAGTATILLSGNPSGQTISSSTSRNTPHLQINSGANTVSIGASMKVYGNLGITSGTLNMTGNNLAVTSAVTIASGSTLTKGGGTLTYGSLSNSGTINP